MKNPVKDEKDSDRVIRGGSRLDNPKYVRTSNRNNYDPADQYYTLGFRLVKNVPKERHEESNKR